MQEKEQGRELERLTVLLDHAEIKRLKYLAVDQGVSVSEIVRSAVKKSGGENSNVKKPMG
jgi:hypothetical protein